MHRQRVLIFMLLITLVLAGLPSPTAAAQAGDCPGAPPTRLTVGTLGRVTVSGEGLAGVLRVRETPGADGRILVDMKYDDRFTVIAGPECAGEYWWWQVVTMGGITGWSAEGASDLYFTEPLADPAPNPLPTAPDRLLQSSGSGLPRTLAWSPDGQTLAVGTSLGVQLYTAALEPLQPLTGPDTVVLAWSPDGQTLAGGAADGTISLWNRASGEIRSLIGHSSTIFDLAWSPDGTQFASAARDSVVIVWDAASGEQVGELAADGQALTLTWNPDGSQIAVGYSIGDDPVIGSGAIRVWDAASLTPIETPPGLNEEFYSAINDLRWSPDGKQLLVDNACYLSFFRLWDAATQTFTRDVDALALDVCPVGADWLADSSGIVWALPPYGETALFGNSELLDNISLPINSLDLAIRPGTNELAVLDSGYIYLLNVQDFSEIKRVQHFTPSAQVDWMVSAAPPSTSWQATLSMPTVTITESGQTLNIEQMCGPLQELRSASFSPDNSLVVVVALTPAEVAWEEGHTCVTMWRAATGEFITYVTPPPYYERDEGMSLFMDYFIEYVNWTPDGTHLYVSLTTSYPGPFAVSGYSGFYVWRASDGQLAFYEVSDPSGIYNFTTSWNQDITRFAIISQAMLKIYDGASLQLLASAPVDEQDISPIIRWSPDQSRIAGSNALFDGVIWDAASGRTLRYLTAHTASLLTLDWSPDGTRIATAGRDNTVRIWDAASGQLLITLLTPSTVYSITWKPDGTEIAAIAGDNTMQVWNVQ
ncbi:MAG TPA: hypothetical protein VHP83_23235 [Aggregatilineaceae bacterium]|nr:hypothetical protein [Aggregatilineaceae bacterium]